MKIEERLEEMVNLRQSKAQVDTGSELAVNRLRYSNALFSLANALSFDAPTLMAFGVDLSVWRERAIYPPDEVPERVKVVGVAHIAGYEIVTAIRWGNSLMPSTSDGFELAMYWRDDKDVAVTGGVKPSSNFDETMLKALESLLGKIKRREEKAKQNADERITKLDAMKIYMAAAKEYMAKLDAYELQRKDWLETEQARLWKPWMLYEVKVGSILGGSLCDDSDTFRVLETPEQIALAIVTSKSKTAKVTEVSSSGQVTVYTIGNFTWGKEVKIKEPSWDYHKRFRTSDRYFDTGYVYVPGFSKDEPAPAPEWIGDWMDVCNAIVETYKDERGLSWGTQTLLDGVVRRGPKIIASYDHPSEAF